MRRLERSALLTAAVLFPLFLVAAWIAVGDLSAAVLLRVVLAALAGGGTAKAAAHMRREYARRSASPVGDEGHELD